MAKLPSIFDNANSVPLQDSDVRKTLRVSIHGLSRDQVCEQMSEELGCPISVHMLNSWIAPGRKLARFPVIFVEAFCRATGCDALKRLLLGPRLCELLELGERAAAILDERARRRVLKIPTSGFPASHKGNGNGASCAR